MKKLFTYLLIGITLAFWSCQSTVKYVDGFSSLSMDSTRVEQDAALQLIAPYKTELDAEMNEVLVLAAEEFPKEKGKAQTKLGNLVADLSLEVAQGMYKDEIDFCLLNFGGLRTSLPQGEITRGKIYELMPFENELVVLTIKKDSLESLIRYLRNVGGQPISGNLQLHFDKNRKTITQTKDTSIVQSTDSVHYNTTGNPDEFIVLTSDYLAQGGDHMIFFGNPVKSEKIGIKLRDAIILYCKIQQQQGKQLTGTLDNRIVFEK
ncbi:MAG: 5'-nucleotidase C-terminal domain-containing protein [Flavobacteriales bacterium]|nr:5'-nucleotidase C-terminal domain-containing protein [Flavobacteriales bacterium]